MAGYLKRRKAASAFYLILVCLIAAGPLLIRLRRPAEILITGSKEVITADLPTTPQALADDGYYTAAQSKTASDEAQTDALIKDSISVESAAEEQTLFIHVAGQVANPGLYGLPEGSRVHHAVEAAGGFSSGADRDSVNIALPVIDGQQVFIPKKTVQTSAVPTQKTVPAAVKEPAGASAVTAKAEVPEGRLDVTATAPEQANDQKDPTSSLIDINSASSTLLEELPGIGPSTAAKIIQHRKDNGPFTSIEGLMDVSGIGPAKFSAIKDMVTAK